MTTGGGWAGAVEPGVSGCPDFDAFTSSSDASLTIWHHRVVRLGEWPLLRGVDGEVITRLDCALILVEPAPSVNAPPMSEQRDNDDERGDDLL